MTELRYGSMQQAETVAWQRAIRLFAEPYALAANGWATQGRRVDRP
ncbi:MAG: hypothetical protein ACPGVG_16220 [Mycobacterium sp.]